MTKGRGAPILVVGVGHKFRRDDGVGPWTAARLKGLAPPPGIEVIEQTGNGFALLHAIQGRSRVIVIDAMRSGRPPGALQHFTPGDGPLSLSLPRFRVSSQQFGPAEAIETARAMNILPENTVIYGIEGQDFGLGESLSPDVRTTADKLVASLVKELRFNTAGRAALTPDAFRA